MACLICRGPVPLTFVFHGFWTADAATYLHAGDDWEEAGGIGTLTLGWFFSLANLWDHPLYLGLSPLPGCWLVTRMTLHV